MRKREIDWNGSMRRKGRKEKGGRLEDLGGDRKMRERGEGKIYLRKEIFGSIHRKGQEIIGLGEVGGSRR